MSEQINKLIQKVSPYYAKKGPDAQYELVYDSASEQLEPIYFFLLDLMNQFGMKVEKVVDNFSSSPGSGHFGEMGQRASIMQGQGSKILGDINTVLRSVLNLVYDLKEFRTRLQSYEGLSSKDNSVQDAARLSLKQIWMDKVDMQKGNSSIKAMALGQAGFTTLIDAFLIVKDEKDVDKLDLNDMVKRILKPRIHEFNVWLTESEKELKKRYELERNYLKSQVQSLKLYSRWAKPYLKAAADLEQKEQGTNPDLVKSFGSTILELTLLGTSGFSIEGAAQSGDLPAEFSETKWKKKFKRGYNSCLLVDFYFRSIPQKVSQRGDYAFGGKATVTFRSYALNDDELAKLKEEISKSDIGDVLTLIDGVTGDSLKQLQDEIDFFIDDKEEEKKKEEKKKAKDDSNPFLALIGKYNEKSKKEEKKKDDKDKPVQKDNSYEAEFIRPLVASTAAGNAFAIYDVYKKGHGMPSYT